LPEFKYKIVLTPRAKKDLKRMDKSILRRLDPAILNLELQPFPAAKRSLIAHEIAQYRLRVGDYRILYDVDHLHKRVVILRVGHRREIYR